MAICLASRAFKQFSSLKMKPLFLFTRKESSLTADLAEKIKNLPDKVNWVEKGFIGPVVNQKKTSACWAFQVVNELNSIFMLATGEGCRFSVQELIDFNAGNDSRISISILKTILRLRQHRGSPETAFKWVSTYGLSLEHDYPLKTGYPGTPLIFNRYKRPTFKIDGIGKVPPYREDYLKLAVASHPVTVSLRVVLKDFQNYKKGIYTGPLVQDCSVLSGHVVQLVGYGFNEGKPVWLIQNSHGPKWGMGGYMYLPRDVEPWKNCYLARRPVYPILNSFNKDIFKGLDS